MSRTICNQVLFRWAVSSLLAAVIDLSPAQADSNLRLELGEVAAAVAQVARELKTEAVSLDVVEFQPSDQIKLKSAGGAGIGQVLAEELQKQKIAVRKDSPLRVSCKYDDVIDSRSKFIAARLQFEVANSDGKLVTKAVRGVFGDAALSSLFGLTANLPARESAEQRDRKIVEALDHPKVAVDSARITVDKATPYAIEILVESDGQYVPRDASIVDGQAAVKLNENEFFAIRLHNATAIEAAVYVAIDGMPLFTFSEEPRYSQVIVPANSETLIRGWFRSKAESIKFQPGIYPRIGDLKDRPKVNGPGVVTAVFSACYSDDQPPPEDEPRFDPVRSFSRSADARGEELFLSNRRIDPASAPAEAEIPQMVPADDHFPEGDISGEDAGGEAAVAEIPPAPRPPRFAASRCVSTAEATFADGVRRNFGVVRTAVTVRLAR